MPHRSEEVKTKGPFVPSQRLALLECPAGQQPIDYLSDEGFRPFDDTHGGLGPNRVVWRLVENREEFLSSLEPRRLVITETGGIGKTTALKQLEYLRALSHPGHLCMRVEAAELPLAAEGYLGTDERAAEAATPPLLIGRFRNVSQVDTLPAADIWRLIHRKIRQGQFSLLVDALDQMDLDLHSTDKKIDGLISFLTRHEGDAGSGKGIRCAVSARPYAVSQCWGKLSESCAWRIAAVAPFTERERKNYLTERRWNLLPALSANMLSVPRALNRLRELADADFGKLQSAADVYRESIRMILKKGVEKQATEFDETEGMRWLALLAFEMLRQGRFVSVAAGSDFDAFLEALLGNCQGFLQKNGIVDRPSLVKKLTELNRLNLAMDNAVTDTRNVTSIRWHDRTLQDFFAAVWCTRYAEGSDYQWLAEHKQIAGVAKTENYGELWRLLCGMPRHALATRGIKRPTIDADVFDDLHYLRAVAPCYCVDGGRSTEMIYRSWPRLVEVAAYDNAPPDPSEFDGSLRRSVWDLVESGEYSVPSSESTPTIAREAARRVLEGFLAEFPRLVLGHAGTPEEQQIAHDLHFDGFGDPIEAGEFAMGDDEHSHAQNYTARIEAPYKLSRFPVTNEEMRLFEPSREARFLLDVPRTQYYESGSPFEPPLHFVLPIEHVIQLSSRSSDYEGHSPEDRCPAIYVTWFDAWAAALWFHAGLPTKQQWECACRGPDHRHEHLPFGWFYDEAKLVRYAWCSEGEAPGKQRTIAVDAEWSDSVPLEYRSPYRVTHMLGNVEEWIASVGIEGPRDAPIDLAFAQISRQGLCGGAFSHDSGTCRAASCRPSHPAAYGSGTGVRLFRGV